MTKPRQSIVSLDATPYYHVITRCVRRAFLCGFDQYTGTDYSHRRDWFMARLNQLQTVFAVRIAAYAIMSNHYHLVVFVDQEKAKQLDDDQVIERWCTLFYGPHAVQKYRRGETLTPEELNVVQTSVLKWRERLANLSWFVRCLNEHIARLANEEDHCTGRFWESRFKSQALLDEKALISCMAYVDLNPIRAKIAPTPEESNYTSIQTRISHLKKSTISEQSPQPENLLPLKMSESLKNGPNIPLGLIDYIELVDWTGRQMHGNKKGSIDADQPHILNRLNIEPENWMKLSFQFEHSFSAFAGSVPMLEKFKALMGNLRIPGMAFSRTVFGAI